MKAFKQYLKEQWERGAPEIFYHATLSCFMSSIKKHGLGGKIPEQRLYDYELSPYKDIKQGCFLSDDEEHAVEFIGASDYADELADKYDNLQIVVFEIKLSDLDHMKISNDENMNMSPGEQSGTYFYDGVIPWNKLKIVQKEDY